MKILIKILALFLILFGLICYFIYSPILIIKTIFSYEAFSDFFEKFIDIIDKVWKNR
jgi:hypothetical protein